MPPHLPHQIDSGLGPSEQVQEELWAAETEEEQRAVLRRRYGNSSAAEEDATVGGLVSHPDLLQLVERVIGPDFCFDTCSCSKRKRGYRGIHEDGIGWHTHHYEPDTPSNRFAQIFFYVSGFVRGDSNLMM